jgi:hypothetical protein
MFPTRMSPIKSLLAKAQKIRFSEKLFDETKNVCSSGKHFGVLTSNDQNPIFAEKVLDGTVLGIANQPQVHFEAANFEMFSLREDLRAMGIDASPKAQETGNQSLHENENQNQKIWKLSRPAHDQIPFIADCLAIEEREKFGRFVITTKNLRPGEVIAIEEPLMTFVDASDIGSFKNKPKSNRWNLLQRKYSGELYLYFELFLS